MKKFLSLLLVFMFASPGLHALACVRVAEDLSDNSEASSARPSCHGPAAQENDSVKQQDHVATQDHVASGSADCSLCGAKLCEDQELFVQPLIKSLDLQSYELSFSLVQIFGIQAERVSKIRPPPLYLQRAETVSDLFHSQSYRGVYLN